MIKALLLCICQDSKYLIIVEFKYCRQHLDRICYNVNIQLSWNLNEEEAERLSKQGFGKYLIIVEFKCECG